MLNATFARRVAVVLLALTLPVGGAVSQTGILLPTLDCTEVVHAEASKTLNSYSIRDQQLKLSFVREANGDYSMSGSFGSVYLTNVVVPNDDFVQFLERTPSGALNIATILPTLDRGLYSAIYSRHTMIGAQLVPSQYLLSCRAR